MIAGLPGGLMSSSQMGVVVFATGILPLVDQLLKSVLLGALLIGSAVFNAAIAIPLGILIPWRRLRSWTTKRRIIAGTAIAFGTFVLLSLAEVIVLGILVDVFLIP